MDCPGCEYRRPLNSAILEGINVCHYCLDTGIPRVVSCKECFEQKVHFKARKEFKPIPFCGTRKAQQEYVKTTGKV